MAINVYFQDDIAGTILAGVVLAVQSARACGDNVEFLRGALVAYQHQALMFQIEWPGIVDRARECLGDDLGAMLVTMPGVVRGIKTST